MVPFLASLTHTPPAPSLTIPLGKANPPVVQPSHTRSGCPSLALNSITRHNSGSVTYTFPSPSTPTKGLFSSEFPYHPSTGHSAVRRVHHPAPFRLEYLHPLVPRVRHIHPPVGSNGHPHRLIQLPQLQPGTPKLSQVIPLPIVDHDALVARIRHKHPPLPVHRQPARSIETILPDAPAPSPTS